MNRVKFELFRMWDKLPAGVRNKPLDLQISILLMIAAVAGTEISALDPIDYLYEESPLSYFFQLICVAYLFAGSLLIMIGLLTHQRHKQILSFCHLEIWGWRLIFCSSTALFIAEFFFGTLPGVSIGPVVWFLQSITAALKMMLFYDEKRKERRLWNS